MSNTVNIPSSVKEIKNAIARRITVLAEWQDMLAKARKNSLRNSRQLQVNATRQQITELQNALAVAIEEQKHQEAVAFVARLAGVRQDFDNGLFD
jgi:beta-glucosidase-like glycosyl hydrolase